MCLILRVITVTNLIDNLVGLYEEVDVASAVDVVEEVVVDLD